MRNIYFTLSILLLIFLVACQTNNKRVIIDHDHENENFVFEEGENDIAYEDLESLIEGAQYIVLGEVISSDNYAIDGTKYKVQINDILKGEIIEKTIDVYERPLEMAIGENVLLFLEGWESEFYPEPLYNAFDGSIIKINKQEIIGSTKYLGSNLKSKDNLINYISTESMKMENKNIKRKVKNTASSETELINLSDYVAIISPTDIIVENGQLKLVDINVLENLKGELYVASLFLPSNIKLNTKYKVYLQELEDGSITLTTRKGSVIEVK